MEQSDIDIYDFLIQDGWKSLQILKMAPETLHSSELSDIRWGNCRIFNEFISLDFCLMKASVNEETIVLEERIAVWKRSGRPLTFSNGALWKLKEPFPGSLNVQRSIVLIRLSCVSRWMKAVCSLGADGWKHLCSSCDHTSSLSFFILSQLSSRSWAEAAEKTRENATFLSFLEQKDAFITLIILISEPQQTEVDQPWWNQSTLSTHASWESAHYCSSDLAVNLLFWSPCWIRTAWAHLSGPD